MQKRGTRSAVHRRLAFDIRPGALTKAIFCCAVLLTFTNPYAHIPIHQTMTGISLSAGVIVICVLMLSAGVLIICVAAIGNPFTLARYCVPRSLLPSAPPLAIESDTGDNIEQQAEGDGADNTNTATTAITTTEPAAIVGDDQPRPSRIHRLLSHMTLFGYTFDARSYAAHIRSLHENEQLYFLEQQIRRFEELTVRETELRNQIDGGDSSRATAVELSRVQRFRYTLAVRTREERRRRRREFLREVAAATADEDIDLEGELHFKHTLTLEDRMKVLDRVLTSRKFDHQHKPKDMKEGKQLGDEYDEEYGDEEAPPPLPQAPPSPQSPKVIISLSDIRSTAAVPSPTSASERTYKKSPGRMAALSASIRSRTSARSALSDGSGRVTGLEEVSEGGGIETDIMCAICLDEYEKGEILASRPESCAHCFHKDCLFQWLTARRADCCPVCRATLLTEQEWRDVHAQMAGDGGDATSSASSASLGGRGENGEISISSVVPAEVGQIDDEGDRGGGAAGAATQEVEAEGEGRESESEVIGGYEREEGVHNEEAETAEGEEINVVVA